MKLKVENNENIRIDKYLSENISESRTLISKMIEEGFILVNNKNIKPSYLVKIDDEIEIKEGFQEEINFEPENIPLDIYFEDEHLMVINKQSGLVVHPGSGNTSHTLVNALMYHTKNLSNKEGNFRLGIVHRLDKNTSGLMIIAKTNKAHNILAEDFKNKKIKREYIALLDGVFMHNDAKINAPIGRDEKNRKQFMVTAKNAKKAITNLKVIKRYQKNTLVKLALETGRTHQIRVHMKYIGHPVHNDPVYNKKDSDDYGQFLHSAYLEFIHPITEEKLSFESPLPELIQLYIDNLE